MMEVTIGDRYEINIPDHDRNGQIVTIIHDSATLDGRTITRRHCIVEDERKHRFIIRKLCLAPEITHEEATLLCEHGYYGHMDDDDNHIGSGDSSISNHE